MWGHASAPPLPSGWTLAEAQNASITPAQYQQEGLCTYRRTYSARVAFWLIANKMRVPLIDDFIDIILGAAKEHRAQSVMRRQIG
jgi:hypothetical protein